MDVGQGKCRMKPGSCVGPEGKSFLSSVTFEVSAVDAPNPVTEQNHCQENVMT